MNVLTITGRLGADAETNEKQTVTSFNVAVNSGWGDNKKTSWVTCKLLGKRATSGVVPYLKKGAQVAVSGELVVDKYDKRDGTKGFSVECILGELDLIGDREPRSAPVADTGGGTVDEEIPFLPFERGMIV